MILGLMSSGLFLRVCSFGVPGQSKTHGYSGFENDVEDLVTDLPAAFVANDVPAAFCAPVVFVDAAMIASDSWVSMLGASLSAFDDAAMLCVQESVWNDDSGASSFMKIGGFGGRFLVPSGVLRIVANSGSSCLVSPLWLDGRARPRCLCRDWWTLLLRLRCDRRVEWRTLLLVHRCDRRVEWLLLLCARPKSSGRSALQGQML